jgi:uncharacterized protein (DUF488 family)
MLKRTGCTKVGFAVGLARLRALGGQHRCAIMCAEAIWWRCHRHIIVDYLLAASEPVFHILRPSQVRTRDDSRRR